MLKGYKVSTHLINDRADRVMFISKAMGFGEVSYHFKIKNRYEALTTTGVLLVLAADKQTIITMYPVSHSKANALFHGKIPLELEKVIRYNEKKYAKLITL